jgi:hypothetical protein
MADTTSERNGFAEFCEALPRVLHNGAEWFKEKAEEIGGLTARNVSELNEELEPVFDAIELVAYWAIRWPFILLGLALLIGWISPRWAQNIIPIVALLPLWLALNLITARGRLMAAIAIIEKIPTTTKYGVGKLVALLQGVVKGLFLVISIELGVGLFLTFVPIYRDPLFVSAFILAVATSICFAIGGMPKTAALLGIGAVLIGLVFFLGGGREGFKKKEIRFRQGIEQVQAAPAPATKPEAEAPPKPPEIPMGFNLTPGNVCATEKRRPLNLSDEDIPERKFAYRPALGCYAEVNVPQGSHRWNRYHIETLEPQKPTDRWSVMCSDGSIGLQPELPSSNSSVACRDQYNIFVQANVPLLFVREF